MDTSLTLFVGVVRQGEFESLHQMGRPLGVLLDRKAPIRVGDLSAFQVVESCDFTAPEADLLEAVDRIAAQWPVGSVLTTYERYIVPGAAITDHLGLCGVSRDAARICADKVLMHQKFVERIGPESTARFMEIGSEDDLERFAASTPFPIVLKPSGLYNSLFVSLNHSLDELRASYQRARVGIADFLSRTNQPDRTPNIQAEEFLEGRAFSVDCLVGRDGEVLPTPVVDILTGRDIGGDDFHHFARLMPSYLSPVAQAELQDLAVAGVQALGIYSAIAHVELIRTACGPRLLEIGARPGGNRAQLFALSNGLDLIHAYEQVRSGATPRLDHGPLTPVAIVSPYSPREGLLRRLDLDQRLAALQTYHGHAVRCAIGDRVGPASRGYTTPVTIALRHTEAAAVRYDVQAIQNWRDVFIVE
jgi:biotin carboxylase